MNTCDFAILGMTPETGRTALQCGRCGRVVNLKGDSLVAVCRVQEEGYAPPALPEIDVTECAGCEEESRRRRARREASLPADIRHPLSDLG
jgi:NMD protein affecting ribosome stability and mRNA decay